LSLRAKKRKNSPQTVQVNAAEFGRIPDDEVWLCSRCTKIIARSEAKVKSRKHKKMEKKQLKT
jgi:hypothetical protein